jgi:arginyl-tRNA synthetase
MHTQVTDIIKRAVQEAYQIEVDPQVTEADPRFGDFATNVAFQLAGRLKRNPAEVAEELASKIEDSRVEKAQSAGGYVNLYLTHQTWVELLDGINSDFGASDIGQDKKAQVEFISANPTGPLTLGNARGGFIGDTVARVLERSGYLVTREYYFNDAGTQISKLISSVKAAAGHGEAPEDGYRGEYIDELASRFKEDLGKDDKDLGEILTQAIFEDHIRDAIERMGIKFDVWFNERSLSDNGEFDSAMERLRSHGLIYEKDGATWLKSTDYGDERDRVLVKSNGDVTYLGNDIAYHLNIFEKRGFDLAIKQWGADHAGQVPSLKLTMQKLLPEKKLDFNIHQFVRLMKDGKEVKMSKRAGTYVTTDELIEEVGADVARFFFLMRSSDSHMDFDLDLAKEQSQKNPYWYVMYSYARSKSILREAHKAGLAPGKMTSLSDKERELVKHMSTLPKTVTEIIDDYGVHRLTHYGIELAKLFHDWYEQERIIKLPKEQAEAKLRFVEKYATLMESYFKFLGIRPLDKM